MEIVTNRLYEGMFLVDAARAGSDWDGVIATIKKILDRAGAEIVSLRKWDDRKLAYEINGQTRGVYILCYFRVDGEKIPEIENSVRLSEQIMRVLILNAEQMTQEDIEKETPSAKAEKEGQKSEEEASEEEALEEDYDEQESDEEDSEEEQADEQSWEKEENEQDDDEEDSQDDDDSDSDLMPDERE